MDLGGLWNAVDGRFLTNISRRAGIEPPYTKPWSVTVPFILLPDTGIIENVCENEKDVAHIFFQK